MSRYPKVNVDLGKGGIFEKLVRKKLHFSADTWEKLMAKAQRAFDRLPKGLDRRNHFVGWTPSRSHSKADDVLQRMADSGEARFIEPEGWKVLHDGEWYGLDECHMGHHPVDAVVYWNNVGRYFGAQSPEVRAWMLNADNYKIQPAWYNTEMGNYLKQLGITYQPEVPLKTADRAKLDHDALAAKLRRMW